MHELFTIAWFLFLSENTCSREVYYLPKNPFLLLLLDSTRLDIRRKSQKRDRNGAAVAAAVVAVVTIILISVMRKCDSQSEHLRLRFRRHAFIAVAQPLACKERALLYFIRIPKSGGEQNINQYQSLEGSSSACIEAECCK